MDFLCKVKSYAEKAVKKGSEVAEMAVKKGGEVAETAKLNINLKTETSNLAKLFAKLGKLCYDKAPEAELAAVIVEIDDLKAEIEALKAEIAVKSGKIICPACKKQLDEDTVFCKYCGTKVEKPAEKPEATAEKKDEEPIIIAPIVIKGKSLSSDEFIKVFEDVMKKFGFKK